MINENYRVFNTLKTVPNQNKNNQTKNLVNAILLGSVKTNYLAKAIIPYSLFY